MKSLLSLLVVLCCPTFIVAQSVKGKVIDKETGKGLFGVQIYYKNTSLGVSSQHDGSFEIRLLPGDYNDIVFDRLGYENRTLPAKPYKDIVIELSPLLRANAEEVGKKDRKWKRLFKRFEKAMIGESDNAEEVEIANPQVVALNKSGDGTIIGFATEPLEIINHAIGYKLFFFFNDQFEIDGKSAEYAGTPYFVEMETEDEDLMRKWEENRRKTYEGSMLHFMHSLLNNQLVQAGYEIYSARLDQNTGNFTKQKKLLPSDVLQGNELIFPDFLMIKYTKEEPNTNFIRDYSSTSFVGLRGRNGRNNNSLTIENQPDKDGQVSYLFNQKKSINIDSLGMIDHPEYLLEYGYWSWERLADLLPIDYHLRAIQAIKEEESSND